MNKKHIHEKEQQMRKENAISVLEKLLIGTLVILTVGISAYAFLFLLMMLI